MNNFSFFRDLIVQKKDSERPQINSLHCVNHNKSMISEANNSKSILLKDLNKERKVLKSSRTKEISSPNIETTKSKEKSDFFERNKELLKKEKIFLEKKHMKMADLEALEQDWKNIKQEHDSKITNNINKNTMICNRENINPSKILNRLVPRSKINLQIQQENKISKSLNETDFFKSNMTESEEEISKNIITTQRETYKTKEIENLLQIDLSNNNILENERKIFEPMKKELKNQLYMKSIFDKYSNIYQKKVPEATKIGKIVNFDKSFNSVDGDETPKISRFLVFQKGNTTSFKEDIKDNSYILKKTARKTSIESEEGKERLKKLFSSKNHQNLDVIEKKKEIIFKEKPRILRENKDLENIKNFNETSLKVLKNKEITGYSSIHKHKRQLSNTLIKLKKNLGGIF